MKKLIFAMLALVLALGISLPAAMPASAQTPPISLVKEADVTSAVEGGTINYTYTVKNDGETALLDVTLLDNSTPIPLTGLTDEDADTYLDDIAAGNTANGTSSYTVPLGTEAVSVENEAVASGWFEGLEYTASARLSIPLERKPAIALTKYGPKTVGYFQSIQAEYSYKVENTGNCSLSIALTDNQTDDITGPEGDDGNGLLDPKEVWMYKAGYLIECTGIEEMEHVNIATAVGTAVTGNTTGEVTARWKVTIFQWLPRTIGYWATGITTGQMSAWPTWLAGLTSSQLTSEI